MDIDSLTAQMNDESFVYALYDRMLRVKSCCHAVSRFTHSYIFLITRVRYVLLVMCRHLSPPALEVSNVGFAMTTHIFTVNPPSPLSEPI